MRPQAGAGLPVMFMYLPRARVAGRTYEEDSNNSAVSPKWYPAFIARRLASITRNLPSYFDLIHSAVASMGWVQSQQMSPSAKKFLERSASRGFTPASLDTSVVIDVIGIS